MKNNILISTIAGAFGMAVVSILTSINHPKMIPVMFISLAYLVFMLFNNRRAIFDYADDETLMECEVLGIKTRGSRFWK